MLCGRHPWAPESLVPHTPRVAAIRFILARRIGREIEADTPGLWSSPRKSDEVDRVAPSSEAASDVEQVVGSDDGILVGGESFQLQPHLRTLAVPQVVHRRPNGAECVNRVRGVHLLARLTFSRVARKELAQRAQFLHPRRCDEALASPASSRGTQFR
jgi:hypothetical protein